MHLIHTHGTPESRHASLDKLTLYRIAEAEFYRPNALRALTQQHSDTHERRRQRLKQLGIVAGGRGRFQIWKLLGVAWPPSFMFTSKGIVGRYTCITESSPRSLADVWGASAACRCPLHHRWGADSSVSPSPMRQGHLHGGRGPLKRWSDFWDHQVTNDSCVTSSVSWWSTWETQPPGGTCHSHCHSYLHVTSGSTTVPRLLCKVFVYAQTVVFTSAKSVQYVKILRHGRKQTSRIQPLTSHFLVSGVLQ